MIGSDTGVFGRGPQKKLRIAGDILIQWGTACNQYAQRRTVTSPGTAQALPSSGDGSRISVQDTDIQGADIHSQLQR